MEETEEILRRLQAEERGSSTYGRPRPRLTTAVRPIPRVDLHGARSPLKFVGDLRVAHRTFVDSATLRGTWPGGPAVEDIKRRVVLDEATREVLVDEVFLTYDPTFSWLGALPE